MGSDQTKPRKFPLTETLQRGIYLIKFPAVANKLNNRIFTPFWVIYEMYFSERPNMKAPRGFRVSLWSLYYFSLEGSSFRTTRKLN
jgi:hypothetical protein